MQKTGDRSQKTGVREFRSSGVRGSPRGTDHPKELYPFFPLFCSDVSDAEISFSCEDFTEKAFFCLLRPDFARRLDWEARRSPTSRPARAGAPRRSDGGLVLVVVLPMNTRSMSLVVRRL